MMYLYHTLLSYASGSTAPLFAAGTTCGCCWLPQLPQVLLLYTQTTLSTFTAPVKHTGLASNHVLAALTDAQRLKCSGQRHFFMIENQSDFLT